MTHYADMDLMNRPDDSLRILAETHRCRWTEPGYRTNCLAHQAVEKNNITLLALIFNRCHCEIRNKDGQTILHRAAALGHIEIVRIILDRFHSHEFGMLDARDNNGNSALHYAAGNCRSAVVSQLLNYGMSANSRNSYGKSALHVAVVGGDLETVRVLCDHWEYVECNAANSDGSTPLYYAAIVGNDEIVRYLVGKGAWIGQVGLFGQTPLEVAVAYRHIVCLESMLELGHCHLDENEMSKIWASCLYLARYFHHSAGDQQRVRTAFANAARRDELSGLILESGNLSVAAQSHEPMLVPTGTG